jgi:hypothetical protein
VAGVGCVAGGGGVTQKFVGCGTRKEDRISLTEVSFVYVYVWLMDFSVLLVCFVVLWGGTTKMEDDRIH